MSVWKKTERVKRTDTSITSEILNLVNKTSKLITELTIVKKDGFGTFRGINVLLRTVFERKMKDVPEKER